MQTTITPQFSTTVQFADALAAAFEAAVTAFPADRPRILRGLSLVEADAVSDCTKLRAGWYTVASAHQDGTVYDVVSNGQTVCNCPDYERHATHTNAYVCKHGYAVLLLRKARKTAGVPCVRRHAYHLVTGESGMAHVHGDTTTFWPGMRRRHVEVAVADLSLGPVLKPGEYPA